MNNRNSQVTTNSINMLELLQNRLKLAIETGDRDMLDSTIKAMEAELKFTRANVLQRMDSTPARLEAVG